MQSVSPGKKAENVHSEVILFAKMHFLCREKNLGEATSL